MRLPFSYLCHDTNKKASQNVTMAALCINLASATARWRHVMTNVAPALPTTVRLHRVEAVNGAALTSVPPLTPLTRLRLRERWRLCNGLQLDSVGALGATLSHVRCWRWLVRHPDVPCALILEDDCVLHPGFADVWSSSVWPMLAAGSTDLLVLGYSPRPNVAPAVTDATSGHLRSVGFEGTHCYAVSQAGARRLLSLNA